MSLSTWSWESLCNETINSTTIWDRSTLTLNPCIESLAIKCPVYAILAIVSMYNIGTRKSLVTRTQLYNYLLKSRLFVTLLILLCIIITLIMTLKVKNVEISLMTCVTFGITISAWAIHTIYIAFLHNGITIHCRGHWSVILAWFLTFLVSIYDIHNVIKRSSVVNPKEILVFVSCILQVIYAATLVPKGTGEVSDYHPLLTVNVDEEEIESIMASYRQNWTWSDLGVAMHGTRLMNRLVFRWVLPMMNKGAKLLLKTPEQLFELPHSLRTGYLHTKFWIRYEDLQLRSGISRMVIDAETTDLIDSEVVRKPVSLLRVLLSCFGKEYFLLGLPKFVSDSLTFCTPLLLNAIVKYKEDDKELRWHGYSYVAAMFGITLTIAFLSTQFQFWMNNLGLKIRSVIITAIYRKCLATNVATMGKLNTGEIVNYMSTDTDRVMNFCPSFHQFWSLPLQIAVCVGLLYVQVRSACLTGVAFVLILIPINKWLANKIGELSINMMDQKDQRVRLTNEILRGILTIKYFVWEKQFNHRISDYRNAELATLKKRKYLDAACVYFWATTPVFITLFTLATYVWAGNSFTASQVFTVLTLVNMLIMPLNAFPWVLNGLVEAWVSLKRIEKLLQLPETNLDEYYTAAQDQSQLVINGDFEWKNESSTSFSLESIKFNLNQRQLIGVIGSVGSGKTSFLHAILSEMKKTRGFIELKDINHGFGYVPQEAWIQQGTIQSNILLGKRYDNALYEEVLEACALVEDLSMMPNGDETQVGDRGMTLSGGQKARISLARACYQDKNFYLLDDPLSAMDVHVARHIFNRCILQLLGKKTVILCTHQVDYMQNADWIIVMKNGTILKQGEPSDILPTLTSSFTHLNCSDVENVKSLRDELNTVPKLGKGNGQMQVPNDLISEEEMEKGTVKFKVYAAYVNAVGAFLAFIIALSMVFMQGTRNASDLWLAYWTNHSSDTEHNNTLIKDPLSDWDWDFNDLFSLAKQKSNINYYLKIYAAIVGCNSIFTLFRAFLFAYGGIAAATNIHQKLINQIFKAPISFFEKNPLGRILNRFSSDLYAVDDSLPFIMNIFLAQFVGLIGTIIVTCYSLPWILLLIIPLMAIYIKIQNYYRHTSREIKRLSAITLSPIYSHFSETLAGLTSIRAFRVKSKFCKENEEHVERNQRVLFSGQAAGQWLSFCLQLIGVVLVTGVTLLVIVSDVSISLAGLAISYGLTITSYLSGVVTSFTETEKEMVNAERALQYIDGIETETTKSSILVQANWPNAGNIVFNRVYLKYREYLPYSLDGVSFRIEPGEKIGIVGRTGAGKSSLLRVLFRLIEVNKGGISIDGVDIARIDLCKLRSSMAIIPQDPFLFGGTIKQNLDPELIHSESDLFRALDQCHLRQVVENLGGLDSVLVERGQDLSQGQKQLFCLARAILTNSKILCIDEATSNVDFETDALIHQTICQIFHDRTVLTIAHRIETIMHCDRILVMGNAHVLEFDSPDKLLADTKSAFFKLANKL